MTTLVGRGKCLRMHPGTSPFQALRARRKRTRPPSGANWNTVDQYRLKPLRKPVVRPIRELKAERQNGNLG